MNYRAYFTTGNSTILTSSDYGSLIKILSGMVKGIEYFQSEEGILLSIKHIVFIEPDDSLKPTSGVVKPLEPNEMRRREKEQREKELSDPKKVLAKIHKRGEEERGLSEEEL